MLHQCQPRIAQGGIFGVDQHLLKIGVDRLLQCFDHTAQLVGWFAGIGQFQIRFEISFMQIVLDLFGIGSGI